MVCGGGAAVSVEEARMVKVGGFLKWVLHLVKRGLKVGVVVEYVGGESKCACIVAESGCR